VRFKLGMQFASKELAKDAVKEHALETRTNLRFKKKIKRGWLSSVFLVAHITC